MTSPALTTEHRSRSARIDASWVLLAAAPTGALIVAASAEWVDFRALRAPILIVVGLCVLATALSLPARGNKVVESARTSLLGAATWGAGGALYTIIHSARGESFDAGRFGPQWSQALGIIGVHALFLGLPTGVAVAAVVHLRRRAAAVVAAEQAAERT